LEFDQRDRSAWSADPNAAALLASHSTVVLGEMDLSNAERQLLRTYVQDGGVLIAARPDQGLSDVFGIQFAGNRPERTLQYFGVDRSQAPGAGFNEGALQYHGIASNYNLTTAQGLAYLYANESTPTANPAVTLNDYGQGRAIAFAFDPAKSVVLTRQGNPDWQNTEGDGIAQYRPHDMFARPGGVTWYDPNRMGIPQADELQRFMANIIADPQSAPLPRMWYLPGTNKVMMVNTGDGEDQAGTDFDHILSDVAGYGGKFSLYLRDIGVANTPVAKEAAWRAAGNEVGVHMYADGAEGAGAVPYMTFAYNRVVTSLENKFGHTALTARSHTIDWTGWIDMAQIEADRGTRLDTNYYHYLNGSVVNPLTANGYFTGSGLPQKFINENGELINIYQAATQWPDEWFADNGLTAAQTINIIKGMFESAEQNGYYSTFVNNVHPVRYDGGDITSTWAKAIWQYCQEQAIPMWSAEMLLDFEQARDASQFANLQYGPSSLDFDYIAGAGGFDLTTMIPFDWSGQRLTQLLLDGSPVEWIDEVVKGARYAMFTTRLGQAHFTALYAPYSSADFNKDGQVNGADLAIWQSSFGTSALGDADGDGDSDGADLLLWQRQIDTASDSADRFAVPECSSSCQAILGMAVLVFVRKVKRLPAAASRP
jgi:hypothetical protein